MVSSAAGLERTAAKGEAVRSDPAERGQGRKFGVVRGGRVRGRGHQPPMAVGAPAQRGSQVYKNTPSRNPRAGASARNHRHLPPLRYFRSPSRGYSAPPCGIKYVRSRSPRASSAPLLSQRFPPRPALPLPRLSPLSPLPMLRLLLVALAMLCSSVQALTLGAPARAASRASHIDMAAAKIRTGDMVKVLSGDDKGTVAKVGTLCGPHASIHLLERVIKIDPKRSMVTVEGVNMQTKHMKPMKEGEQGRIVTRETPMHISKVTATGDSTPEAEAASEEQE
eukprot:scaffold29917_cov36-Tisochrysis_lutea.AAC.7